MFIILGTILEILFAVYILVALALFINFIIRGFSATITVNNEKHEIVGFKKYLTCLGMSLIWPVILIKELF